MKILTKAKQFFTVVMALSLLTACLPELLTGENDDTIESQKQALNPNSDASDLIRSPLPQGEAPAHRQTRSLSTTERSGEDRATSTRQSSTEPCEAEALITSDGPALVFKNLNALQSHLPFSAALSALSLSNGGAGTSTEQEAIIQSMIDTFSETQMVNSISNTVIDIQPRPQEANMNAGSFISQMIPLAAFNRLDLAANDGSNCGEQRITYALGSPTNNQFGNGIFGQFTIIFEARYPNPLLDPVNIGNNNGPTGDISDCLPVAQFWENLVTMNDDNDRAIALSEFFFTGHTLPSGIFLPPVVTFANYQSPMGQIRTNQFVDSPWELREFRTDITTGSVTLIPDTNKGNPVTALYDANSAFSGANPTLRQNFLAEISAQMDSLLAPEINGLTAPEEILTSFEPAFGEAFSGFTSQSQGSLDNPSVQATQDVRSLISAEINARLGNTIPASSTVNEDQILNRIGAMTCGGCHQFSGGAEITASVDWPFLGPVGAFVHVRDTGGSEAALSTGLTGTFLPLRRQFLLDTWLCAEPTGCVDDDDCDDDFICVAGECIEEPINTGCVDNSDCPYGQVCEYGECVTPQISPVRDACREPHADVTRPVSIRGNSGRNLGTHEGTCGGPGAEDVVVFTPEESGVYCLDTRGSRFDTVLHVREARCGSSRSEIGCATSQQHGRERFAQMEIELMDGPYFIFVDSAVRGGGDWILTINEGPCERSGSHTEPENACEEPSAEQIEPGSIEGDNNQSAAEFEGTCGGIGGEEVVVFTPENSGLYCLNTRGSEVETALYVRAGECAQDDAEIGCASSRKFRPSMRNRQREVVGFAELELRLEGADTYYVFIDALSGRGGNWVLNITEGPCRRAATPIREDEADATNERSSTDGLPSAAYESEADREMNEARSRERDSEDSLDNSETEQNEDDAQETDASGTRASR